MTFKKCAGCSRHAKISRGGRRLRPCISSSCSCPSAPVAASAPAPMHSSPERSAGDASPASAFSCAALPAKAKGQETRALGSPGLTSGAAGANAAGQTSLPPYRASMPRGLRAGAPEPSGARPTTLCSSRRPPADPPPPPLPHGPAQPDVRAGTFGAASGYCCCRRPPPPPPPPPATAATSLAAATPPVRAARAEPCRRHSGRFRRVSGS